MWHQYALPALMGLNLFCTFGSLGYVAYLLRRPKTVKISVELCGGSLPRQVTRGSAGYDLEAVADFSIDPHCRLRVETGLRIAIPEGFLGLVVGRSGLGFSGLENPLGVGVYDSDYRGTLQVPLHNQTTEVVSFRRGDRIGQLLILERPSALFVLGKLSATQRGANGFGSTTNGPSICLDCGTQVPDEHDPGCRLDFSNRAMGAG
jgi:dUTP pyrophosphatase